MTISWLALFITVGMLIIIALALFLPLPSSRRGANSPAERQSPPASFRDDERYWYSGLWYNNPDDPALFVPRRSGLGWTLNFGHPQARPLLILLLVLILLLGVVLPLAAALFGSGSLHPSGCHTFGCIP